MARICVVGGGNLGHAMAGILAANTDLEVSVLTRQPGRWSKRLRVCYRNELEVHGRLFLVSDDPAHVVPDRGLIFITLPTPVRPEILKSIHSFISRRAWVGAFPGGGGFDWVSRRILGAQQTVFGVQRTPYIARTIRYGSIAAVAAVTNRLHLAAIPRAQTDEVGAKVERLLNIPVTSCDNYLCVTLAPANPVYHPSRLYALFRDWRPGVVYNREYLFYAEWDDTATELYCACDREIQEICRKLPLDMRTVTPILDYYGVRTRSEMASRIRSLEPLRDIRAPMVRSGTGFIPDLDSRFFREDIPWGLLIIRSVAELAGIETPAMDRIIHWAEDLLRERYLVAGRLEGPDTASLPLPRHLAIHTIQQLAQESG